MMNDKIKKAYDSITPDSTAKERMLRNIMAKSEELKQEVSAEPQKAPWYIRLKTPIGFCTAAMACAMVFTIALTDPAIVKNGGSRQQMLETQTAQTTEQPKITTIAAEMQNTTYTTSLLTGDTTAVTEAADETEIVVSTAVPPTTAPVVHSSLTTDAAAELTTTAEEIMTTTTAEMVVTTETSAETVTTTTEVTTNPSLYGDLYDFNLVTWAGRSYATDYVVADYSQLSGKHLGSGVATGENAEGIYTILLYELQGVPVEEGFAVQYAGQTAYYIFYSID